MKKHTLIALLYFSVFIPSLTAQDISFDWQIIEDYHRAGEYDSLLAKIDTVESYFREIGFDKQLMITEFYHANALTYKKRFAEADSLYKSALELADITGEQNKYKEILYRRIQIHTDMTENYSVSNSDKEFLLLKNLDNSKILNIPDIKLNALHKLSSFYYAANDTLNTILYSDQITGMLQKYLPKSAKFEDELYTDLFKYYSEYGEITKLVLLSEYNYFRNNEAGLTKMEKEFEEISPEDFKKYKEIKKKRGF